MAQYVRDPGIEVDLWGQLEPWAGQQFRRVNKKGGGREGKEGRWSKGRTWVGVGMGKG